MCYRNVDEIPLGTLVWIEFLPDSEGIADEDTTAVVIGKTAVAIELRISGPGGAADDVCYRTSEQGPGAERWRDIDGEAEIRIAPVKERVNSHPHHCWSCGSTETHAVPHGCREPFSWLCEDWEQILRRTRSCPSR